MLSLYRFAAIMGLHPLHFMQVDAPIGSAESRACIEPILQYPWQAADAVSRVELRQIIDDAEREIADYLGYWPSPRWTSDQFINIEQPYRVSMWNGYTSSVFIPQGGHYIAGGQVAKSVIAANSAVVYTDVDGDGYFETATVGPIAYGETDTEEIALYYPGEAGDDDWQIEPIKAVIDSIAGTVTITCRREQLVVKTLLESLDAGAVDGLNNSNFLTTIDVYRKYHDPSLQAYLVWRGGVGCGGCAVCCGLSMATACLTGKDKVLGIVTIGQADWDADEEEFVTSTTEVCRRADYARVWYRSGYRDQNLAQPNITMAREMELAVARLAISKIDRNICSCKTVQDIQAAWNTDLRRNRSIRDSSSSLKATPYELENAPFGTTVAGMAVWRALRRKTLGVN